MYTSINDFVLLFSLLILAVGPLLVWPSKYNLPSLLQIGFSITAYIIPILILGRQYDGGRNALDLYTDISFIGSLSYLLGMFLLFRLNFSVPFAKAILSIGADERRMKIVRRLAFFILVGMPLTYLLIGFVPLLSKNPMSAKFLRGSYHLSSFNDFLFRLFPGIASVILPLLAALWLDTKRLVYLVCVVCITVIFILNMTRGAMGYAILLIFGLVAARYKFTSAYILITIGSYFFASLLYLIFGISNGMYDTTSIYSMIASGAPDVSDQVGFMQRFIANPNFTYGLTFIGGLVPGQYEWNPGVWSVTLGTGADINNLTTGGLRLPGPIMAYTAFGIWSVPAIMFLSGSINGVFLKLLKRSISSGKSYFSQALALIFYINVGLFLINFYWMTYLHAMFFLITISIVYKVRRKFI